MIDSAITELTVISTNIKQKQEAEKIQNDAYSTRNE